MNELKAVLAAFLTGQAEFAQVDAVLVRSLQRDPTIAPSAFAAIDQIYKSGRLPLQLYVLLKNRIAQSHAATRAKAPPSAPAPAPVAPAPPAPAPPAAPQDRTIFNPGAAAPPPSSSPLPLPATQPPREPPPPATHAAPPPRQAPPPPPPPAVAAEPPSARASEPEAPPSDRTIMRGRPPPRAPGISQPHSGSQRSFEAEPEPAAPVTGPAGPITGPAGPVTGPAASPTGAFDLGHSTGPSDTSHTGGANTGRTSNTGTGITGGTTGSGKTGTGSSSWTDPAKWEDRPQVALEHGSVLKGRFVLENVVGRGGMGVVFRAKDLRKEEAQDRDPYVAVKILNDEFRRHPESLKALQREARKSQQLAHPNIVSVFDFDRDGGTVYMTMEFLEGEALDKIIKNPQFEGMPLAEAYPLVRGLGSALSYAHDKGIVHSDFKPGNCFLTKSGVIKVFDFGIAQAAKIKGADLHGEETKFDAGSLGALTPAYASCEMIAGEQPDTRDDIYALGCVVYELLTGKHPFSKKSAADARDQKLVPAPIKRLTRRQWRAIEKSLAFRRADRTASVWELVDGLAKQQLFSAPRIAVGAAAIVVLGVGAYFAVGSYQQHQTNLLTEALTSGDDARVPAAVEKLKSLDGLARSTILLPEEVRGPLLDWYDRKIDLAFNVAAGRYNLAEARRYQQLADELITGLSRNADQKARLARDAADLLKSLSDRFEENLTANKLLQDPQGDDIADVLAILAQIAPTSERLTDARLAKAYADQATAELEKTGFGTANQLIAAGLERFPDNPSLIDLNDRIKRATQAAQNAGLVAGLRARLDAAGDSWDVEQLLGLAEVAKSELLSADDPSLRPYRARLARALDRELTPLVSAKNWEGAEQLVGKVGALLPAEEQRGRQERITNERGRYESRLAATLEKLDRAVTGERRNDVRAALAELRGAGADAATLEQATATVVDHFTTEAQRLERTDIKQAIAKVDTGLAYFDQGPPALTELKQRLTDQQRVADERGKVEADKLRQEQLARLQQSVDDALKPETLTLEAARAALTAIGQLSENDPKGGSGARDQVAGKLAAHALALGDASQRWADAIAELDGGLKLMTASAALQDARKLAVGNRDKAADAERAARASDAIKALDALVAAPGYDDAWVKRARDQLTVIGGLVSPGELADQQRKAAGPLLDRANEMRGNQRFSEAKAQLDFVKTFAPRLDEVTRAEADLRAAVAASEAKNKDTIQAAQISALKDSFTASVNAERTDDAKKTLEQLRALVPTDPFVTATAPQQLADVYLRFGRNRLAQGSFTDAENLARLGLAVYRAPALQSLLTEIRDARFKKNVDTLGAQLDKGAGDANADRLVRNAIKADAGDTFGSVDAGLASRAQARIDANPGDANYVRYVNAVFERQFSVPVAPAVAGGAATPAAGGAAAPVSGGVAIPGSTSTAPRAPAGAERCTAAMAGNGKRAVCFDTLAEGVTGPRLVVVPMGGGFGPFAIGRTEVTVGNWNDYCRLSTSCSPLSGGANQAATNVAASAVEAYAKWLTDKTGSTYRLPTAAEWAYVKTAMPGDNNCIITGVRGGDLREATVGTANAWGLLNFIGNVQELVKTGSGYEARGGHYKMQNSLCQSDRPQRSDGAPDDLTGFRLVRELGP